MAADGSAFTQDARVTSFLDVLYGAAVEPSLWPAALDQARQLFEGNGCHVATIDLATGAAAKPHWVGYQNLEELLSHGDVIILDDPWMQHVYRSIESSLQDDRASFRFHGAEHIRPSEYRRTPFYNEIVRVTDSDDSLAAISIVNKRWMFGLATNTGGGDGFADEQLNLFDKLRSHIDRAFALHHRLSLTSMAAGAARLWDASELPVVVFRGRELEYENAAASAAIDAGGLISRGRIGTRFVDGNIQAALEALSRRQTTARHASLISTTPDGERWLVQLTRLGVMSGALMTQLGAFECSVIAVLTPLSTAAGRSGPILGMAELTPAERAILQRLVAGTTPEGIALATARSIETVRWHIRNMIEKTSAGSLSDLVRVASLLLPF